jgi:hypothetical protein
MKNGMIDKIKKKDYLKRIHEICSIMSVHIECGIDNNTLNTVNNLLIYDDTQFVILCENIVIQKLNIKRIPFCNHTLLYHQLDSFINNLMFVYQFYRVYSNGDDCDREKLFNLINYIRSIFPYLDLNTECFIESYYSKIPEYIDKIIQSIIIADECDNIILYGIPDST